jgi:hypothetical protein
VALEQELELLAEAAEVMLVEVKATEEIVVKVTVATETTAATIIILPTIIMVMVAVTGVDGELGADTEPSFLPLVL